MTIDRSPSLTEQVMSHLKERIRGGEFHDSRIPPETELAADLGVSRTTVRDALSRLEHEGFVVRRQGSGTWVNRPVLQIKSRLEEIWSYEQMLRDHGYTPSVRVRSMRRRPAVPDDADALGIATGDEVLEIEKVFLEDDVPAVLTRNRIPQCGITTPIPSDAGGEPIFEFLDRHCGLRLAYYLSEIVPAVLDADRAEALGVAEGTASICFEETGFDAADSPVVRATSWFRDDLVRFRLMRRRIGG